MNSTKSMLSTSIYSFTDEWQSRRFTLDQMIEKVAELNAGPGIEMVGFQSIRGFPNVSDAFAEQFRTLVERLGLTPTALGGNVDPGRNTGRLLTMDETVADLERQIEAARKLGFPILRIQFVSGEILEKILPAAEHAQVHVACELHAPATPAHPSAMVVREICDRTGTQNLGLVLDFSSSMIVPPTIYWQQLQRAGASNALIEVAGDIWRGDEAVPEKFGALARAAQQHGASPAVMGTLNTVMTMFAHMPVDAWREALPYSRHVHGKFYSIDENGNEPAVPYPQIIALLKESGYHGSISAEWEGHAFTGPEDAGEDRGFEQVQRWHAMVKRLLAA